MLDKKKANPSGVPVRTKALAGQRRMIDKMINLKIVVKTRIELISVHILWYRLHSAGPGASNVLLLSVFSTSEDASQCKPLPKYNRVI